MLDTPRSPHLTKIRHPCLLPQLPCARGVTVKVTPNNISPDAGVWSFAVVFDTHSQDLNDDLMTTARGSDDGREFNPLTWRGAPAGGHHREGTLELPRRNPQPKPLSSGCGVMGGFMTASRMGARIR
jgi:hypothetical protein